MVVPTELSQTAPSWLFREIGCGLRLFMRVWQHQSQKSTVFVNHKPKSALLARSVNKCGPASALARLANRNPHSGLKHIAQVMCNVVDSLSKRATRSEAISARLNLPFMLLGSAPRRATRSLVKPRGAARVTLTVAETCRGRFFRAPPVRLTHAQQPAASARRASIN